jgi:hypothetical protein
MTQERFYKILEDPMGMLPKITYEEIKTLALAYPYNNNLKAILAVKAKLVGHPEYMKSLANAAAYHLERTQLFLLTAPMSSLVPEKMVQEAVLELKPIESVQRKLGALETMEAEKQVDTLAFAHQPLPQTDAIAAPPANTIGAQEAIALASIEFAAPLGAPT